MDDRYLFKAKRIDNGKWIEGSYVYTFTPDKECPVVGIHKENHWIVEKNGNIVIVDPSTICQCTGLKDKNGKLIWENDIMKYQWDGKTRIDVVKYEPPMFSYKNVIRWSLYQDEVIGNIFDNPELIER